MIPVALEEEEYMAGFEERGLFEGLDGRSGIQDVHLVGWAGLGMLRDGLGRGIVHVNVMDEDNGYVQ